MKYRWKVSTENRLFLVTGLLSAFDVRLNDWEDSACSRHKSLKSKKRMVLRIFNPSHQIIMIHMYIYTWRLFSPICSRLHVERNYSSRIQSSYYPYSITSIPFLLQLSSAACPDPNKSSLLSHTLFKVHFNIILPSTNGYRESALSSRFSTATFVSYRCCKCLHYQMVTYLRSNYKAYWNILSTGKVSSP